MTTPEQSEFETYRVVVPRHDGTEILLVPFEDRFVLPSVEVSRWQRVAEGLTVAMKSAWRYELTCLFTPELSVPPRQSNDIYYEVAECCDRAQKHDDTLTRWVPFTLLSQDSFVNPADFEAIRQSLAQWHAYAHGPAPGPFAKPGWFRELCLWVDEVIGPMGLRLNGSFCQLNASPSFSLIRLETNGSAIWFKAVGEPNIREFSITCALAQSFPNHIAPVLATRPDWNGWLTVEIDGTSLQQSPNEEPWKTAATALANLQIASINQNSQYSRWLNRGARDLRTATLLRMLDPFLDVMAQLMEEQSKVPPRALARQELLVLGEHVKDALFWLGELGIPDTLGHLDLNPGNIIVSPDGCKFLDWAEAYVGHPFFSLEYLLEHFRRSVGSDPALDAQLLAAYARPWRALFPSDAVARALAVSPILAVAAYAAGNDVWSDREKLLQPGAAGYLRSLTRRLKRESDRRSAREASCQCS